MHLRASPPRLSGFTGTARHPRTFPPFKWTASSIMLFTRFRAASSSGMKSIPIPYDPCAGKSNPSFLHSLLKNVCGIWVSIPAPSPVFRSPPMAPRCSRFRSIVIPSSTIWWDTSPLILATNPTPQLSCSKNGSYSPCAFIESPYIYNICNYQ